MKFIPAILPDNAPAAPALTFLFCEGKIVLNQEEAIPCFGQERALVNQGIYLGTYEGQPCYVARIDAEPDVPEDCMLSEIRPLHATFADELYALIGYASQILTWRENHQFCSKCGAGAVPSTTERAMVCNACGFMSYPRISPSIIVAVTKGPELLMARGPHFPAGLYSVVAGFLEPGETLEQCVAREVREETGIEVSNICYFASQPWAFPHSVMIGFTADYAGGELKIDPSEIEDAGWFMPDALPEIPSESTIARWLIDDYLKPVK
ncbi:NAD(+) diphosphatase [Pontiella sulfatireligans]|uniref:NAD(+) diphosphatase n=1 Tax=Pontiella sulfatireligans TaxID=2750658 RepID=A0A6C2UPC9_9BACT|nr:NAD(+) diphosphatase [Pontiella sulfatireligans]VGO21174.1 NADH pyrophosphatase [Pontiella sulfatireligans]